MEQWEQNHRSSRAFGSRLQLKGSAFFVSLIQDRDWKAVEAELPRQKDGMHGASKLDETTRDYIRTESAKDECPIEC